MSIVLLTKEGAVARKFLFVYLPDDYVVPEGMTVSWRTEIDTWHSDLIASCDGPKEPSEAYFYFGDARGQVIRTNLPKWSQGDHYDKVRYGFRTLTITVQGTSASDVMRLRDYILQLIDSGASWGSSNDLNPKPKEPKIGLVQRFKQWVGAA